MSERPSEGAGRTVTVVTRTHGRAGAVAATGIVATMLAKRVAGNRPPDDPTLRAYLHRLVFDGDPADDRGSGDDPSDDDSVVVVDVREVPT